MPDGPTTPDFDSDGLALIRAFDLDRLKGVDLSMQVDTKKAKHSADVARPLVYAWQVAARELSPQEVGAIDFPSLDIIIHDGLQGLPRIAALTSEGEAGLISYYLFVAAIYARPIGTDAYSDAELLERATRAASSAASLIAMVDELIYAAQPDPDDPPDVVPAAGVRADADGEPEQSPQENRRLQSRATMLARAGEWRRSYKSLKPLSLADPTDPEVLGHS